MTTYPQHVLDKYRDFNVDHDDWHKEEWDEFKRTLTNETHGLHLCLSVGDLAWRGFWSQGDGASFTFKGTITHKDGVDVEAIVKMISSANGSRVTEQDEMALIAGLKSGVIDIDVTADKYGRSHYCHENTVKHGTDLQTIDYEDEDVLAAMPLSARAALTLLQTHIFERTIDGKWDSNGLGRFEEAFNEWARSQMRRFYRILDELYDYLTSDEAVAEAIEANDLYDPNDDSEEEQD